MPRLPPGAPPRPPWPTASAQPSRAASSDQASGPVHHLPTSFECPKDVTSRVVSAQHSRNTGPELALRRGWHDLGLRYRVHLPVPGLPRPQFDVDFVPWRMALFVHGCSWHACPQRLYAPKHNAEWWWEKIGSNVIRDRATDAHLIRIGWLPLRIWEYEPMDTAIHAVVQALALRDPPRAVRIREAVEGTGDLSGFPAEGCGGVRSGARLTVPVRPTRRGGRSGLRRTV
ncbi:very short patch repair endonuclease [Streptomyces sp. NPDC049906]|uniref:very short patch repair endonuclease n=1 Tax=Streptomyces sp. NPDC049906 TaxID=3155656 RepID=UPI003414F211